MDYYTGSLLLQYISIALLTGAGLRFVLKNSPIPYTVVLLCLGLLIGMMFETQVITVSVQGETALSFINSLDPHLILLIFLPLLIFESAYSLEVHLFNRALPQITVLAIPGLIISMVLTATLMHYVFNWSWVVSMLFGALISATDPVAVVALLKEMNSRKRLQTLLEGESLLNDGTAIVLFTLFFTLLEQASGVFNLGQTVVEFLRVVSLGVLTGAILGWLTISWIKHVFNDSLIEITLSVVIAYLSFYIAEEVLHSSGIVAVVTIALIYAGPGRSRISPEVSHFLHHFWEVMAYFANTIIFILAGYLIAPALVQANMQEWFWLFFIFFSLIVIRTIAIVLLMPILMHLGLGITLQKVAVLVWGGLRGAVALAMALVVAQSGLVEKGLAQDILFYTGGIVFLSMVVNATTMSKLMQFLGLDKLPPEKQLTIDKAKRAVNTKLQNKLSSLEQENWLNHTNWSQLKEQLTKIAEKKEINAEDISNNAIELSFRRRLLEIERKSYWNAMRDGIIDADTAVQLSEIVESVLDKYPAIGPRESFRSLISLDSPSNSTRSPLTLRLNNIFTGEAQKTDLFVYELCRAFVYAQKLLLNFVDTLAPNETCGNQVKLEISQNIEIVNPIIQALSEKAVNLLEKSDTHTAQSIIYYTHRQFINDMVKSGVLDEAEAVKIIADIEKDIVQQKAKL